MSNTASSSTPIHCQLCTIVKRIRESLRSMQRTFAALNTWASVGDVNNINLECVSAAEVVSAMSGISVQLEQVLRSSRVQLQRSVCNFIAIVEIQCTTNLYHRLN